MMLQVNLQMIPSKISIYANAQSGHVYIDAYRLSPAYSLRVYNHATAFAWGNDQEGACQLALAILLQYMPISVATLLYHDFKEKFVATWDGDKNVSLEINLRAIVADLLAETPLSQKL